MILPSDGVNVPLAPGTEILLSGTEQSTGKRHVFRLSTVYWVWFIDANGVWWQREATMNASMPGRLKKLKMSTATIDNATFTRIGPIKRVWVYGRRFGRAVVWQVRNVGQSTKRESDSR